MNKIYLPIARGASIFTSALCGLFRVLAFGVGLVAGTGSVTALEVTPQVLVDYDAVWRFDDSDQDLGEAWREFDYDDSDWPAGPGLLGYDTQGRDERWPAPGLQTLMQEHLLTYYLRTSFDYQGTLEGQRLLIEQILDDAAVYYLNGVEIARSALMPDGEIEFGTRATHWTDPWDDHEVLEVIDPPLRHGRNVLAVSLHNAGPNSSDICLGVRMTLMPQDVEPIALYLTWQQDPTTTMTIQWQTIGSSEATVLLGNADGEQIGRQNPQQSRTIPSTDRWVYAAELTGLEPGTDYTFRLQGIDGASSSPVYRFRTMPATLERPLRIAMGGDVRHRQEWMEEMNRVAMRYDLDMIVWGGDLAYADGRPMYWYRWEEFFEAMMNTLIDDTGRLVPILFGIGNHEVQNHHWFWNVESEDSPNRFNDQFRERIGPFYFSMFAFPGHPGYGLLDFGDYMSILLLDTDHAHPMVGPQTDWFEQALRERQQVPHVFPVYHVPAWPSHRPFDGPVSERVRELWVPLMERYGIQVAFENHDHTYKRTVPIRDGRESPDGIVYMGDGCWGVRERDVRAPEDEWYLAHTASRRHFILITVTEDHRDMKVIDRDGMLIDHVVQTVGKRMNADSKPMILVPGGTIVTETGRELSASSFQLSASEVTWDAWRRVRAAADERGYDIGERGAGFGADDPVHSVTWYDVVKWCNLRSEIAGRTPVYWVGDQVYRAGVEADVSVRDAADGYRLLTDAEWEYAVLLAEQNLLAHNKEEPASRPCPSGRVSMLATQSAGSDMSAELWEWCFDLLPGCEAEGRVVRGGRQSNLEILCRMGLRGSYPPDESSDRIGFRVVLPASDD